MLHHKRKVGPLVYQRKWFAQKVSPWDLLGFVSYRQYQGQRAPWGFIRKEFHTQIIDLTQTKEELLAGMKKNTAYEVRRAEKDGTRCQADVAPEVFLQVFNLFAPTKNLGLLEEGQLSAFGEDLWITGAYLEDRICVVHAYIKDGELSRARLMYSATAVEEEGQPSLDRAVVGRANRALHWFDMVALKEAGIQTCDLGGLALQEGDDSTQGIDQFKMGFGGTTVREDHYDTPLLILAQKITGKGA